MTAQLGHAEIESLLGAYALDAVDGSEAEAVELHLQICPRCRAEVAEHRETAALLGHTGAVAPAGLWDRIAGELEEPPPDLALGRLDPAGRPGPVSGDRVSGDAALGAPAPAPAP
ncbi:MAG: zf-HC2 domain-containing protein, partial [Acidimicrobiales bacterium]